MRKYLARIKRKLFAKPFIKDERYAAFWFNELLGGQATQIVQIGSNDGKTGDPLYELFQKNPLWTGLFVEPIPYLFERLQANYTDKSRFRLENVAINQGEQLPFYWVDAKAKQTFPDLPYWYDQLGSFDKDNIIKGLGERIEDFIISETLEGITLPRLLERNAIKNIDILHIDAEGYDWKILSQLDLSIYQSKFILFEYHHLSKDELQAAQDFLSKNYILLHIGIDLLAVHNGLDSVFLNRIQKAIKVFEA